jgi:hypothetical protein
MHYAMSGRRGLEECVHSSLRDQNPERRPNGQILLFLVDPFHGQPDSPRKKVQPRIPDSTRLRRSNSTW